VTLNKRLMNSMNDTQRKEKIAAEIARVKRIFERTKPRGERRSRRFDKKTAIRKVITMAIFNKHYTDLQRHWMLSDLGLHKNVNPMKNYKQWKSN